MSEQERDRFVDESLDRLGDVPAPSDLVESVMAEVSAAESRLSAWRRWRRAARGQWLTNFVTGTRVSSNRSQLGPFPVHGGVAVRNKILWTVTGVAAAALVSVFVLGYPPMGRGTEATIGVAQRYQGAQISAKDIKVPDSDVQQFIQSEQFDRLLKDSVTRNALKELFANEMIAESIAKPRVSEALTNQAVQEALHMEAFRQAIAVEGMAALLADDMFMENMNKSGLAFAIQNSAVFNAAQKTRIAEEFTRNRAAAEAMVKYRAAAEYLGKLGVAEEFSKLKFTDGIGRSAVIMEALHSKAFADALNQSAMNQALLNQATRSAIHQALVR